MGLYGSYILENYSKEEILRYEAYMQEDRNHLFNYSGLELLINRYVIRSRQNVPLETVQEMFLGIAMHLAMLEEKNRDMWVLRFYDMLSTLKVTMATPTLSNARKPYHQLSSCFIDTVPDSLDGIYRSIDNFAKVSKFGGGMGPVSYTHLYRSVECMPKDGEPTENLRLPTIFPNIQKRRSCMSTGPLGPAVRECSFSATGAPASFVSFHLFSSML